MFSPNAWYSSPQMMLFHYNVDAMRRNLTLVSVNEPMAKLVLLYFVVLKVAHPIVMLSEELTVHYRHLTNDSYIF